MYTFHLFYDGTKFCLASVIDESRSIKLNVIWNNKYTKNVLQLTMDVTNVAYFLMSIFTNPVQGHVLQRVYGTGTDFYIFQ